MGGFTTLVQALQHWARTIPQTPAVIFRDKNAVRRVLTWASLHTLSGRFAACLRREGLGRGQLVVNTLPNSPERYVCEAAVWMSAAASVNGQCLLADGSDLLTTLRQSRAPAVLVDPDVAASPWHVLTQHVTPHHHHHHHQPDHSPAAVVNVTSTSLPDLRKVFLVRRVSGGQEDFLTTLTSQEDSFQADDVTPEDHASVFTTSGTTGFSKLVVYTHGSVCGAYDTIHAVFKQSPQFNMAPLGWVGGSMQMIVVMGLTRVTCDSRAGLPEDLVQFVWDSVQEERCLSGYISPILLPQLAQRAEKYDKKTSEDDERMAARRGGNSRIGSGTGPAQLGFSDSMWKLNVLLMAGLPVTRVMAETGLKISNALYLLYGSTDGGFFATETVTDSETYVDHSTGKPFPHTQLKIVRVDDESVEAPPNQVGYILTKNSYMMKEYLNDPENNSQAFTQDGFFRTGDLGRLDQRGHLIVEGRGSDAIMRGVYIFYPSWLESRILSCPGVRQVLVVGVPDPALHQELCACVILDSTDVSLDQVRQFVEKDVVASEDDPLSPRPRYYLAFQSFPRTGNDKPKRTAVTEMAAERLGLSTKSRL